MDKPAHPIPSPWAVPVVCILLVAATWAVFGQTVGFGFVNFDDNSNVYLNPEVGRGLSWAGVGWAFTHAQVGNWIPLTTLSHMLDCQLFGLAPGGHHLTNVLLHTLAVLLLFLVLHNLTRRLWPSAWVAAVFALHPLRAESVAWVSERKDVLSAVLFLLTIAAYARYARRSYSLYNYALVALLLALGLLAKPMLVTLPGVLLLLDRWPLGRTGTVPWSRLLLEKVPLLALSVAAAAASVLANREAIIPLDRLPLPLRLENAAVSAAAYLGQLVWPAGLAAFYPHPKAGLPAATVLAALALLAAVSAWVFRRRHDQPALATGWLWYLGMLVPVLGLVQAGALARADRYTYLPQIGVTVLIAWAAADFATGRRVRRLVVGAAAVLVLPPLLVAARAQTAYWRDSETLWTHTLACTDPAANALAHGCLALALSAEGRNDEAMEHYRRAVEIRPDAADYHQDYGTLLLSRGRFDEAVDQCRRAVELKPDWAEARGTLGLALFDRGEIDAAIGQYRTAVELNPAHYGIRTNLGLALLQRGRVAAAIEQYQSALQLNPQFTLALNNLAWVLATCPDPAFRNGARAVTLAREAGLTNDDPAAALDTLAAALAEAGQWEEAVSTARRGLDLAIARGDDHLAAALREELTGYQAGRACRDTSYVPADIAPAANTPAQPAGIPPRPTAR